MAEIALSRVDFRLIHGQIIVKWRKVHNITKIIVVDDILAADDFMAKIYRTAAPQDIVVKVYSEDKALRLWEKNQFAAGRVMLLFKDIATCGRLIRRGLPLSEVQLGGIPHADGKKMIMKAVSLCDEEVAELGELNELFGVSFSVQVVPENTKLEYAEILKIFRG